MLRYKPWLVGLILLGCSPTKSEKDHSASETLIVEKISDHVYQHITFLNTESFGKVDCNGMIVTDGGEAIIFDTPADNETSLELINWVENNLHCKIKAIIPTHFHLDCLGGLEEFHKQGISSYANNATITLTQVNHSPVPENGFDNALQLTVGTKTVWVEFVGEGHTKDNVIAYFPEEEIVFGGCLVKEVGAGNGNLEDANVNDWPMTIARLKEKYPNTKTVIPGHGKTGGIELLDYTIELFEKK